MITILGAVLGFFSSLAPDLIGLFRASSDRKHELAVLALQAEAAERGHSQKLAEIEVQADIAESQALYKHASIPSGVPWIEGLRASVRPIMCFSFFALYASVKGAQMVLAFSATGDAAIMITAAWHESDMIIFSTIIAYYFGARNAEKIRKHFTGS